MASHHSEVPQQVGQEAAASMVPDNNNNKDEWNEARLEEGLKTLKEMHIQLRNLREAIPRLISPMIMKSKSPEALLTSYKAMIQKTNADVITFKELIAREETKKVMEYVEESKEKNGIPTKPWIASDHPGWSIREA